MDISKATITFQDNSTGNEITRTIEDLITKGVVTDDDFWQAGNASIFSLVAGQKLADYCNLVEKDFKTEITPTEGNKQQHVVNIWLGYRGDQDKDNWVRGSGEASMMNTGVIEDNKYDHFKSIDSKFRFAIAEKRAFMRALVKAIKFRGMYSEIESKDFGKDGQIDFASL